MFSKKFMNHALKLARIGRTSPNPKVGCVITKFGLIVGQGYHKKAGLPHAEIEALKKAGKKAKNATMYVNLEPCCVYGRTPPCTNSIIKAGIRKVFVAMQDPNPKVNGKGIEELRKAGIKVELGVLEKQAKKLNEAYTKYITTKLPFVILKQAASLDGKIATKTGESRYISNRKSRHYVHNLRNDVDAVLVGINTVLKDNPRLTCRIPNGKDPKRIIVDSRLRIPSDAHVLKDNNAIIAATKYCDKKKKKELEDKNIELIFFNEKKIKLRKLMEELAKKDIISVLMEGGAEIAGSAIDEKIVDKVIFIISPKIIGGRDAVSAVGGKGIEKIDDAVNLKNVKIKGLDNDVLIEGYIQ